MFSRMGFVCLLVITMAAGAAEIPELDQASRPFTVSVAVNCAAGQRVQDAIDANAGPVEIVITGFCTENVLIRDKDVTLRGAVGPPQDGIRSALATMPALTVRGSGIDAISNLSFSKSAGPAVMIRGVNATLASCEFASNGGTALNVAMGAFVTATGLLFDGNIGRSMNVTDAQFFCTGCDVNGNNFAVVANRGATASLLDSVVTGRRGILAVDGGTLADLDCVNVDTPHACSMRVTGVAAQSVGGASATLFGAGDFTGQVTADEGGTVALIGARQIAGAQLGLGPSTNIANFFGRIVAASLTDAERSSVLSSNLDHFARLVVTDNSTVNGTVQCTTAADAVLDPTVVPRASFKGCDHVVGIVR
jgi:hypothetical protein